MFVLDNKLSLIENWPNCTFLHKFHQSGFTDSKLRLHMNFIGPNVMSLKKIQKYMKANSSICYANTP